MKQMTVVTTLLVVLVMASLAGCTLQPLEAPTGDMGSEAPVDTALNPELRLVQGWAAAKEAVQELAGDYVMDVSMVTGDWICDQEGGPVVVRMEADGRLSRVLAPDDVIDVGYFWFSGDEFHVMSDVDQADHVSVFHVAVETGSDGTFLRFEPCGGDCADAAGVEWLNGLKFVESPS